MQVGDAIGASDDACAPPAEKEKGEEAGKLKSFARRFCPAEKPSEGEVVCAAQGVLGRDSGVC